MRHKDLGQKDREDVWFAQLEEEFFSKDYFLVTSTMKTLTIKPC